MLIQTSLHFVSIEVEECVTKGVPGHFVYYGARPIHGKAIVRNQFVAGAAIQGMKNNRENWLTQSQQPGGGSEANEPYEYGTSVTRIDMSGVERKYSLFGEFVARQDRAAEIVRQENFLVRYDENHLTRLNGDRRLVPGYQCRLIDLATNFPFLVP